MNVSSFAQSVLADTTAALLSAGVILGVARMCGYRVSVQFTRITK